VDYPVPSGGFSDSGIKVASLKVHVRVILVRSLHVAQAQITASCSSNPSHPHSTWDDPLEHGPQIVERGAFHSLQAGPVEQSLSFPFPYLS